MLVGRMNNLLSVFVSSSLPQRIDSSGRAPSIGIVLTSDRSHNIVLHHVSDVLARVDFAEVITFMEMIVGRVDASCVRLGDSEVSIVFRENAIEIVIENLEDEEVVSCSFCTADIDKFLFGVNEVLGIFGSPEWSI